ncbi:amidohydrolase family protein [Komagataeibacter oboediens]
MDLDVDYLLANPTDPELVANQRLCLNGRHIERIAPSPDLAGASRRVAMPPFANAHDHGRGFPTLSVGIADGPLEIWMARLGLEPRALSYLSTACAFTRMAEAGIGAVVHCHNTQDGRRLLEEAKGVAQAAQQVGIRVAFALPFAGENPFVYGETADLARFVDNPQAHPQLWAARHKRTLEEGLLIFEELKALETDTFTIQFGPVGPQWTNRETLEKIAEISAAENRRVHMHFLETKLQRDWADHHFPQGIVTYFDEIGLLSPRLTLAHCVWLQPWELDLLIQRGVTIACNLSSNMRLCSGFPPLPQIVRSGITFGIGLDGMALEDDDDILREARLVKGITQALAPGIDGPGDMNLMLPACLKALMQDGRYIVTGSRDGGRLAAGEVADVVVLDTGRIHATAPAMPLTPDILMSRLTHQDVDRLIINGKTIVENGRCRTVSRSDIEAELRSTARFIDARTNTDRQVHDLQMQDGIRRFYRSGAHLA